MKSYYTFIIIFSLGFFSKGFSQKQIGLDIYGDSSDQAMNEVALNSDGTVAMIGSNGLTGEGRTEVYQFNGSSWIQIGQDIYGEFSGDGVANAFAINDMGTIMAIGAKRNDGNGSNSGHVRVYELLANNWTQLGNDIDGEAQDDQSGYSIALNSSGTILAVGAPFHQDGGHVKVYEYINDNWVQLGADIDGVSSGDRCGTAVDLSADGTKLAIGSTHAGNTGHVRVFEFVNSNWVQIGAAIVGEASGDQFGRSVALNNDGSIMAGGAWFNDGNGGSSGHVRVFEYISAWSQIGQDIEGEAAGDMSGRQIALSGDGNVIVIGAAENDGGGEASGHTRVFNFDTVNWTQAGSDIDGAESNDFEGLSVAISRNGQVIGSGASGHDSNGFDFNGRVRMFDISAVLGVKSYSNNKIEIYPNPIHNNLFIRGVRAEMELTLYNIAGQEIFKKIIINSIDLSWLKPGFYIVTLGDGSQSCALKLVKK